MRKIASKTRSMFLAVFYVSMAVFIVISIVNFIFTQAGISEGDILVKILGGAAGVFFGIAAIAAVAICIVTLYQRLRKSGEKETSHEPLLVNVTDEQYNAIVRILIEAGKEPKTQKSTYQGANRDAVSNVLIALCNKGKMPEVTRANLSEVITWLEGIDGLDARFSESPDDFLEKFSNLSALRQRRVSAFENLLESSGI